MLEMAIAEDLDQAIPLHHDLGRLRANNASHLRAACSSPAQTWRVMFEQIPAWRNLRCAPTLVAMLLPWILLHRRAELPVDLARSIKSHDVLADQIARALAFGQQRVHDASARSPSGSRLCVLSATTWSPFSPSPCKSRRFRTWKAHSEFRNGPNNVVINHRLAVASRRTP